MFENLNKEKVTYREYFKMTQDIFVNNFNVIFFWGLIIFVLIFITEFLLLDMMESVQIAVNYFLNEDMLEISKIETYTMKLINYSVIQILTSTLYSSLVTGGMIYITKEAVQQQKISFIKLIKFIISKIFNLFFTRLLFLIIIIFTTAIFMFIPFLLFIPLYLSIVYIFHLEESVFENKSIFKSINGSKKLIKNKKGRFFDMLSFYFMFTVAFFIATLILDKIALAFNIYGSVGEIFSSFISYVLLLFFSIPTTLKYINFKKVDKMNQE